MGAPIDAIAQLTSALSDRYEILREIGAGGMATVYLARDIRHDRNVALKVLKPELGAVLGVERFLAEIKVTANLQHPNLLPLFDSGEAAGLLFYVMPFVDGESLRARLERETQLPVDDAVRMAVAVASALEYAHGHGVIHRDLKPENILLQAGQPVIADFGIALAVSKAGGARITQTGLSHGTPQYMSPEQATGDRGVDGRTDIYSLGAVTYEMLTGEPPHAGSNAQAIIAKLMTEEVRPLSVLRRNVPQHVDLAVRHALEKLAADRFQTAREFAEALEGRAVTPRAPGAAASRSAGWRANIVNPVAMTLAVVALASLALAAFEWTAWSAARRATPRGVIRFSAAVPAGVRLGGVEPVNASKVAIAPDGQTIAFLADDPRGNRLLYVRQLDDDTPRPVASSEGASQPCFSPDSRWIAFWSRGKLEKVELAGGLPQLLADIPLQPEGLAWPTNDLIVGSARAVLFTVPSGGGRAHDLTALDTGRDERQQQYPVALGDGTHVLYSSFRNSGGLEGGKIAVASLTNGRTTILDLPGTYALGVVAGSLVFAAASGAVMAAPFDTRALRVTGPALPVVTGVARSTGGAVQAALSPSGDLVFMGGSLESSLVSTDARGVVTPVLSDARVYSYPRYAPDGTRIAISIGSGARTDVWVYDVASRTPTRLTTAGLVNERPEWSPDGTHVLYRADEGTKVSNIWWAPADLSGPPTPLLRTDRGTFFEAVMTPDGKGLVVQVDTSGDDIWYRALTGDTTYKPIATSKQFFENMPRVSPDGHWVAFVTDESGSPQVVVQPFPGPGARVAVSSAGGGEPVWAHDGHRLFYRGNGKIMAANVTSSPSFAVTSRDELFDDVFLPPSAPHANYDVSPDGKGFLFLKSSASAQLVIVHNWAEELRQRLSARAARR